MLADDRSTLNHILQTGMARTVKAEVPQCGAAQPMQRCTLHFLVHREDAGVLTTDFCSWVDWSSAMSSSRETSMAGNVCKVSLDCELHFLLGKKCPCALEQCLWDTPDFDFGVSGAGRHARGGYANLSLQHMIGSKPSILPIYQCCKSTCSKLTVHPASMCLAVTTNSRSSNKI